MNILVLDTSEERRSLIREAISWIDDCDQLFESETLEAASEMLKTTDFRIVIVGPELPGDTLSALVFLRGKLPHSALLTSTKISHFDRSVQKRLLDSGADLVFDQRMAAIHLAILLRPYFSPQSSKSAVTQRPGSSWQSRIDPLSLSAA